MSIKEITHKRKDYFLTPFLQRDAFLQRDSWTKTWILRETTNYFPLRCDIDYFSRKTNPPEYFGGGYYFCNSLDSATQ